MSNRERKPLSALDRVVRGLPPDFGGRAAASTVEALIFELREHGIDQLKTPRTQARLAELSAEQLNEVLRRLEKLRQTHTRTVTNDLIQTIRDQK